MVGSRYSVIIKHYKNRIMKLIFISFAILLMNIQFSFAQDETEEWKLFTSKENNFSIQFPDNCTEIVTKGPMSESRKEAIKEKRGLRFSSEVMNYSVTFGNNVVPIYCLTIYNNPDTLELKEFTYKIITYNSGTYQESDITIDSLDFKGYNACEAIYENNIGGYTGIKRELFIQRNNEIIRFGIYNTLSEPYKTMFDKIVSTLKIYE